MVRGLLLVLSVCAVTFFLVSKSPIDPLQANVGQAALGAMSEEQIAQLEQYWGMDQTGIEGFLAWIKDLVRGRLGVSLLYRQPVTEVIGERLKNSLFLMMSAWLISGLLGFFLGGIAGANARKWQDKLIRGYALLTAGTPAYWIGLLLLLVFGVWLGWFPIGFGAPIGAAAQEVTMLQRLHHAVLPTLALSITGTSSIVLHTREKMAEVMGQDFVIYALARGEGKRKILFDHGFRNILLPAVTLQFASVGEILGGSILIEQVFSYPGLGQAAVNAGLGSDFPLLMAIAAMSGLLIFCGNLTANLLYRMIDPRMRRGGGAI